VLVLALSWFIFARRDLLRSFRGVLSFFRDLRGLYNIELPRYQQRFFVETLQGLAFNDPVDLMTRLWADDRNAFVSHLWRDVIPEAKRASLRLANLPDTGSGLKQRVHEASVSAPGSLETLAPSNDHLDVTKCKTRTGHLLAIVRLPPTRVRGEALFFVLVLPDDGSLRQNLTMARQAMSFFVLERRQDPPTDLTGWSEGCERIYNCGAPEDVEGLARVVELKLKQAKERRARRSATAS